MKNFTIAHRIWMMIAASVSALLLLGAIGMHVSDRETESLRLMNDGSIHSLVALSEARQAFMQIRLAAAAHTMSGEDAVMRAVEKKIDGYEENAAKIFKDYEKQLVNSQDRRLLEADVANLASYLETVRSQVFEKSRRNEKEAARSVMFTKIAPLGEKVLKDLEDHIAYIDRHADEIGDAAIESAVNGRLLSLLSTAFGLIATSVLGFFLLRNVRASLGEIQTMVKRVENDLDFRVRVRVERNDEIGQALSALNRLLDKLQANLKSITEGAHTVAKAAGLVATTSNQVAAASHQQSEAASSMAATVEQMTVSVNHVSDRAIEANRLSSESGQLAISGASVIGRTVNDIQHIAATVNEAAEMIHGLEQRSEQISDVVSVIKEVADQTNLLALNAAIEAARAGEQGRGFAVVADEVRKLAERTATSTTEIAETISTMRAGAGNAVAGMREVVDKVGKGVDSAQEANASIEKIGASSRSAVAMVDEITAAIREQGSATNNIATQVERIAQMSEESSAAAGNSAQTAAELDRLAADMQRIVSAYRL
jgi:methyl-accepting chemotaxis protein